jgi:NitT/TauT family transport system substrate-binding protein
MPFSPWSQPRAPSLVSGANAQDNLKLAVGQKGNWATSVAEVGQRAGIFKKHGLTLELLYTQGSGETRYCHDREPA